MATRRNALQAMLAGLLAPSAAADAVQQPAATEGQAVEIMTRPSPDAIQNIQAVVDLIAAQPKLDALEALKEQFRLASMSDKAHVIEVLGQAIPAFYKQSEGLFEELLKLNQSLFSSAQGRQEVHDDMNRILDARELREILTGSVEGLDIQESVKQVKGNVPQKFKELIESIDQTLDALRKKYRCKTVDDIIKIAEENFSLFAIEDVKAGQSASDLAKERTSEEIGIYARNFIRSILGDTNTPLGREAISQLRDMIHLRALGSLPAPDNQWETYTSWRDFPREGEEIPNFLHREAAPQQIANYVRRTKTVPLSALINREAIYDADYDADGALSAMLRDPAFDTRIKIIPGLIEADIDVYFLAAAKHAHIAVPEEYVRRITSNNWRRSPGPSAEEVKARIESSLRDYIPENAIGEAALRLALRKLMGDELANAGIKTGSIESALASMGIDAPAPPPAEPAQIAHEPSIARPLGAEVLAQGGKEKTWAERGSQEAEKGPPGRGG